MNFTAEMYSLLLNLFKISARSFLALVIYKAYQHKMKQENLPVNVFGKCIWVHRRFFNPAF